MGTYESCVTSCSIIACGKIGAKASGPTGSMVAGFKGGSSWKGRSGTRLYQLSGMAFSSRTNFVCCISHLRFAALRDQTPAYSFSQRQVFVVQGIQARLRRSRRARSRDGLSRSSEAVAFGDPNQQLVVVADHAVDAEVDHPLHRLLVVDGVRDDLETRILQLRHCRAVVVSRVLAQVPIIRNDCALVGVVHLPVGGDRGGTHPAH